MENIQSGGVYKFINAKAGNCMDLSGGDNTSVIGFDYHGGDNQKVPRLTVLYTVARTALTCRTVLSGGSSRSTKGGLSRTWATGGS